MQSPKPIIFVYYQSTFTDWLRRKQSKVQRQQYSRAIKKWKIAPDVTAAWLILWTIEGNFPRCLLHTRREIWHLNWLIAFYLVHWLAKKKTIESVTSHSWWKQVWSCIYWRRREKARMTSSNEYLHSCVTSHFQQKNVISLDEAHASWRRSEKITRDIIQSCDVTLSIVFFLDNQWARWEAISQSYSCITILYSMQSAL